MNELDPITFPLQGSRLIEASAGTGKTFTISLLYLRLVLGHRGPEQRHARPLTPPEILVSTFTEAAVAELRDRIRSRLQQAAWLFAGTRDEHEVDQPLRDLYDEFDADERARGAFLLQRAAEWMDEAAIFTIHGFCQRQLAEHAFHSGALFEQELITDLDPLIHVAVRDFWRTHGYPLTTRESLARQFARLVDTPGALKEKVRNLIKRDGSRLAVGEITAGSTGELPSPAELLDRLSVAQERADTAEGRAREAWLADIDTLHGLWNGVRPGLSKTSHAEAKTEDTFAAWLAGVDDWAAGTGTLGEPDRKKLARPSTNKGHEPPEHPALDAIGDWHAALARLDEQVDEIKPTVQAFAALWIRERIASLLASRRAMGFEDMLIQMRDAVDPERNPNARGMIEAIRSQYPVAMIDEFQDTDPLQYAIFSAVYPLGAETPASDEHAIVLIGDPKQAIYSFRGADIHSYLTARRATAGRHASLPCNFRSTDAMVGAVNAMFSVADEHPDGAFRFPLDGGASPLPFEPVKAQGRDDRLVDRGGELPAVTLWASPPDEVWTSGAFRDALAVRAAGEIAALLNRGQSGSCGFQGDGALRGLEPRDIAVLVRTQDEGKLMRRALADFGVPAVFLSERSSVFASTEAADMLVWLEALAEPARSDRIRQALATASMALPLEELEALLRDETQFDAICQRFHEWHRTWQSQGVLAAIMGLLHHFSIPARLLETDARQNRRGERRLTNLLHLAEWLQQTDQDVDGETALLHRLHLAVTEGAAEQEIRLEQDNAMVRIVTIHGSKGLQYPVVFLPFIALLGADTHRRGEPTRRHRDDGSVWEMAPTKEANAEAAQEAIAESIRLFYVAMTRAEYACVLGAGPVKFGNAKAFNPGKTAFGQFLGFSPDETCDRPGYLDKLARWAEHAAIEIVDLPEPLDPRRHRFTPPPEPALHGPRIPHFEAFEPWWISSFSALTASIGHRVPLPAPEGAREEVRLESQAEAVTRARPTADHAVTARTDLGPTGLRTDLVPIGIHALPRGAQIGTLLHDLIEAIAADGFHRHAQRPGSIARLISRTSHPGLRSLDEAQVDVVARSLETLLASRWRMPTGGELALAETTRYQAEMEFWLAVDDADLAPLDRLVCDHVAPGRPRPPLSGPAINGMLKGFIDLALERDGRYYVIDWKSNWLGPDAAAYTPEALEQAMLDSRYDLQFVLYLVALHRHLRDRLPDYDYDRHVGGAAYVFLRGIEAATDAPDNAGVYTCRPDRVLIESLDRLFAGEEVAA
ncbi:exodeoxyribonuclease V subunit beta [Guyparkeria hydrothermalis]|uniref:exodeoxyribonuclease V subunit beta n=1 Tax=Guyparkeria TaxID=2035712 RepID=UPI0010AD72EF|nr:MULTISPECIES: exodeoxyribonuclease V subunit beta [Guyparkeria]MCL7752112.1 exodeoxyribonuclease V subunit beta [Guyparkeria hydrothermalis]TKA91309.1 exodeoxyribonuclease V subunit beta [Guyparkeria sp. SB14A]